VCAVQDQYDRLAKVGAGRQAKTEIVVVNGRAVHSPRGFWVLTESGCAGIPLAEVLETVEPKVSFELVKDERYQQLQNARDRSQHEIVLVQVEGRLDHIGKKEREVGKGGSGAIHISRYKYSLALRRVLAVQVQ